MAKKRKTAPVAAVPDPEPAVVPNVPKPPPAIVNPIVERGFVPSDEEYDLLSNAVMVAAHAAAESGHPAVYQRLRMILVRIAHSVQAPAGLKPEQIERFRKRAADGLRERDSAKLAGGVQDLIAATCRTDPDPGDKVAFYLLQLVADLMREHGNMGIELLGRLDGELATAQTAWNESKWPTAPDVLSWIRETLQIGIENLQADRDPWPVEEEDAANESDPDSDEGDEGDETPS